MAKTKNRAEDLNNLLFEQLERLADADSDILKNEIEKSKAIAGIADKIIQNGKNVIEAEKLKMEYRPDGDMQPHFSGYLEG